MVQRTNSVSTKKWVSKDGKEYRPLKAIMLRAEQLKKRDYQRNVDIHRVENIIENFRMELLTPLKVLKRNDGTYSLIDGQHRYVALTKLFGEDILITCIVTEQESADWVDLSQEECEARTFAHQHDNTKQLTKNEKFNAALIGKEQYAVDIKRIAKENGFEISLGKSSSAKQDTIACVGKLIDIYKRNSKTYDNGYCLLDTTLRVLRKAYDGSASSLTDTFMEAVANFIDIFSEDPNYDEKRFILCLKKYTDPEQAIKDAKFACSKAKMQNQMGVSTRSILIDILIGKYNYKRKVDNKLLR